jgi:peptidyl-prolyl cis-trans isomerase C
MKRVYLILMAGVLILGMGGCGDKSPEIATVNGKPVTQEVFDAHLKFKRIPPGNDKMVDYHLKQYLERQALASVIEKEELLDNALLQAELNDFRAQMLISRYFENYLKEKVTDQAIRNYYTSHAADYEERKVHLAHVLIRTNRKMSEPERQAKLTTAQEVYSKIKSGEDFAKVAETYSEDRISGKKGGDLGWLKEGSVGPRFSKTAFEMEPGEVSLPIETQFGFHVIKLIEGPKVIKRPFEAVAGDIRYQLRAKARKAEVERLTSKANIEIKVDRDKPAEEQKDTKNKED